MSDNNIVTKADLKDFYDTILPYLGGGQRYAGPIGMIIPYMGNTAPNGYLACDGSWYNITDYPKLSAWMMSEFNSYSYFALSGETVQTGKFKVPDLRGEFLRGTGTNAHTAVTSSGHTINCGSGSNVGVHQNPTIFPKFIVGTGNGLNITGRDAARSLTQADSDIRINTTNSNISLPQSSVTSTDATMITSRPTNTSVLYCIKYEEFEGEINFPNNYTTGERIVGSWIDGKPLYQKTINIGTLPNNTNKTVAHNISNAKRFISITGYAYNPTTGNGIPLVYPGTPFVKMYVGPVNITISTSGDMSASTETYITLQYTKTT